MKKREGFGKMRGTGAVVIGDDLKICIQREGVMRARPHTLLNGPDSSVFLAYLALWITHYLCWGWFLGFKGLFQRNR